MGVATTGKDARQGGDGGGSDTAEACTRGNRHWVAAAPTPPSPPPPGPSPSDGWLGGGGRRGGGLVGGGNWGAQGPRHGSPGRGGFHGVGGSGGGGGGSRSRAGIIRGYRLWMAAPPPPTPPPNPLPPPGQRSPGNAGWLGCGDGRGSGLGEGRKRGSAERQEGPGFGWVGAHLGDAHLSNHLPPQQPAPLHPPPPIRPGTVETLLPRGGLGCGVGIPTLLSTV